MIVAKLLLAVSAVAGSSGIEHGAIRGVVLNASRHDAPVGQAEVVLRVKLDGQLVPMETAITDVAGRFAFERLPVGLHYDYLPGANRDGVHYPGRHVRLSPQRPEADVTLKVHDSIASPNPLVIRRHEILICPQPGALHVTESIVVCNPTLQSYVGQATGKGDAGPVTLRLAIPSDFERTTFDKEFFGRRFSLADGKLVTTIPWTPGVRELEFTYVLRNTQSHRIWRRPLDLPCDDVRVRVRTTKPEEVACNLPQASVRRDGEVTEVIFQSTEKTLPAGYVLQVELGNLPVPWMVYGRWTAVAALILLTGVTGMVMIRRGATAGKPAR